MLQTHLQIIFQKSSTDKLRQAYKNDGTNNIPLSIPPLFVSIKRKDILSLEVFT